MSDPSPDTPNAYAPRCGHHGNPLVWLDPALRWRCPHCFPELFPAARPAAGSSSPDTAALVGRLRCSADASEAGKGEWYQLIHRCREAADALEAQAARITELEAAIRVHRDRFLDGPYFQPDDGALWAVLQPRRPPFPPDPGTHPTEGDPP